MTMTLPKATKLAKQRHGKNASVRVNKRAITQAAREELKRELAAIRDEETALTARQAETNKARKALLPAAEFVCDVNGDHPSIDQLREAVRAYQAANSADERLLEIRQRRKEIAPAISHRKYEVVRLCGVGGVQFNSIHECADTLDELAEKLGLR